MSGLGAWTLPTLDPHELEKRITDLKRCSSGWNKTPA